MFAALLRIHLAY